MSPMIYAASMLCLLALTRAQFSLRPYNNTAAMAFRLSDRNADGVLDKSEAQTFFQDFDANGDGRVSFQEYSTYVHNNMRDPEINSFYHALYEVYDVNNDNHFDQTDINMLFTLLDFNGDNVVERQEFIKICIKM